MSVQELEAAVAQLSSGDRAAFRAWFAEFYAMECDRQIEGDVAAGRLDWLVAEALDDRVARVLEPGSRSDKRHSPER